MKHRYHSLEQRKGRQLIFNKSLDTVAYRTNAFTPKRPSRNLFAIRRNWLEELPMSDANHNQPKQPKQTKPFNHLFLQVDSFNNYDDGIVDYQFKSMPKQKVLHSNKLKTINFDFETDCTSCSKHLLFQIQTPKERICRTPLINKRLRMNNSTKQT